MKYAVRFGHVRSDFISFYWFVHNFAITLKDASYKSNWDALAFCDQWKMMADLRDMSHAKMSGFVSYRLFGFTLVIKLGNFYFEIHWNILMFLIKRDMTSDFNMSHAKTSDFASFTLFKFTLVMKLRYFDFENRWNTLILFDKKNDVRFEYVLSKSIWFCLSFTVWGEFRQ